jgi:hypothetical protein
MSNKTIQRMKRKPETNSLALPPLQGMLNSNSIKKKVLTDRHPFRKQKGISINNKNTKYLLKGTFRAHLKIKQLNAKVITYIMLI